MTEPTAHRDHEIPAATVVIFRQRTGEAAPELLMLVRSRQMSFAGGAAVFPGGRVDEADRELAARMVDAHEVEEYAARIAGVRETLEEAGLAIGLADPVDADTAKAARAMLLEIGALEPVLAHFDWRLDLAGLVPFARWFPRNEKLVRVFDTRFYLHDLGTGAVEVTVDETENTRLFWTTAADALEMAEGGEISVIFPTRRNLERLAQFASFDEARLQAEAFPVRTIVPRKEVRDGEQWLVIPTDAGYPIDGQPFATMIRG